MLVLRQGGRAEPFNFTTVPPALYSTLPELRSARAHPPDGSESGPRRVEGPSQTSARASRKASRGDCGVPLWSIVNPP